VPVKSCDAVFLDLPEPWLAIDHAKAVLKNGKKLCAYSPCIEQVIKTCAQLRSSGFNSIYMIEVRGKPYDGRYYLIYNYLIYYIIITYYYINRNMEFENLDLGRGDQSYYSTSSNNNNSNNNNNNSNNEKNTITTTTTTNNNNNNDDDDDDDKLNPIKRSRIEDNKIVNSTDNNIDTNNEDINFNNNNPYRNRNINSKKPIEITKMLAARPISNMKGHTAFLTFATCPLDAFKPPININNDLNK
jgi:tRNA (adenine57-N1/adenine58-N1)-methyltransferase